MLEKLKSFLLNDQIFFAIIVVLVGIASFCLGRASMTSFSPERVEGSPQAGAAVVLKDQTLRVTTEPKPAPLTQAATPLGTIVGSKSGTKYHLTSCPGAKQIKEENKIYFKDTKEAEAAGYKPAANCPQLP